MGRLNSLPLKSCFSGTMSGASKGRSPDSLSPILSSRSSRILHKETVPSSWQSKSKAVQFKSNTKVSFITWLHATNHHTTSSRKNIVSSIQQRGKASALYATCVHGSQFHHGGKMADKTLTMNLLWVCPVPIGRTPLSTHTTCTLLAWAEVAQGMTNERVKRSVQWRPLLETMVAGKSSWYFTYMSHWWPCIELSTTTSDKRTS